MLLIIIYLFSSFVIFYFLSFLFTYFMYLFFVFIYLFACLLLLLLLFIIIIKYYKPREMRGQSLLSTLFRFATEGIVFLWRQFVARCAWYRFFCCTSLVREWWSSQAKAKGTRPGSTCGWLEERIGNERYSVRYNGGLNNENYFRR